jgi:hypothetical protein
MSNTVRYDDTGNVLTALGAVNEVGATPSERASTDVSPSTHRHLPFEDSRPSSSASSRSTPGTSAPADDSEGRNP